MYFANERCVALMRSFYNSVFCGAIAMAVGIIIGY